MKFKLLNGKIRDFNVVNTLIDWHGDSLSEFQRECKDLLHPFWQRDIVCEEFRIFGRMSFDFFNVTKRIAVEVQGRQHGAYNPFMHQGNRFKYQDQVVRDLKKVQWCEINNIKLVEIKPDDLPKLRVSVKAWFKAYYDITL